METIPSVILNNKKYIYVGTYRFTVVFNVTITVISSDKIGLFFYNRSYIKMYLNIEYFDADALLFSR